MLNHKFKIIYKIFLKMHNLCNIFCIWYHIKFFYRNQSFRRIKKYFVLKIIEQKFLENIFILLFLRFLKFCAKILKTYSQSSP